ncbi:cell division cycle- protein [Linnemannia zychae]|nr:cell division cycle- protein [Linnemannia zychae]
MLDAKISDTYSSIVSKQATPTPSRVELQNSSQDTAAPDIKRPQEPSFEPRKKAKMLLETSQGNGKSANRFSQSARILQSRPHGPSSDQLSARTGPTEPFLGRPLSRLSVFKISPDAMTQAGKAHSKITPNMSTLSKTTASTMVSASLSMSKENLPIATITTPELSTAKSAPRAVDHSRLSLHKNETDYELFVPQSNRSMTFSGPVKTSGKHSIKQLPLESPFSQSPFLTQGPLSKTLSSPNPTSAAKRLGRTQSLLQQATLSTSPMTKLETQAHIFFNQSSPLSDETPWLRTMRSNRNSKLNSKTKIEAKPLNQESSDESKDGRENDTTIEELDISSSLGTAMESCTAAMVALSPPSMKKKKSKSHIFSGIRMSYQPSFVTKPIASTSLSKPSPDTEVIIFNPSNEDISSNKAISSRPQASHKSQSSSSISTHAKRSVLFRRHQTMISSRNEFMKTLESNYISSKKSKVVVPDDYVPDPLREECQILPSTQFVSKPNDTTQRVSPKTVVDVLEGKYKDKYDVLHIIDCRFPYEFDGGHIKSAVNINTTDELDKLLLQPVTTNKRVLLIFHCEFSSKRAPRLARHLRNQDRAWNVSHYPALFYPEVYVMEGGYSSFFEENKSYCRPEAYVRM